MKNFLVIYPETNCSNFSPSVCTKLQSPVKTLLSTEKTLTANPKWNIVIVINNSESYMKQRELWSGSVRMSTETSHLAEFPLICHNTNKGTVGRTPSLISSSTIPACVYLADAAFRSVK